MKTKSNHTILITITFTAIVLLFIMLLFMRRQPQSPTLPDALHTPAFTVKGTVAEYGSNPDKDIDKLLVKTNDDEQWLRFPPHAARAVLMVAPLRASVEVAVRDERKPGPDDRLRPELVSVTNAKTGKVFSVTDVPPPLPAEGKETEISGNILSYEKDNKNGRIRGIIIARSLILLPPHAGESLLPLLTENKNVTVKGWERNKGSGFVNEDSLTVIRPYAFIIDGTQYLIQ